MFENLLTFLRLINENGDKFFIEAEGRPNIIQSFIEHYNNDYHCHEDCDSEGIIQLKENANKWSLELRLYVKQTPPAELINYFKRTSGYRNNYNYRLNNNEIIRFLFESGYRLGEN